MHTVLVRGCGVDQRTFPTCSWKSASEGTMWGKGDVGSATSSISKCWAPAILSERNAALPSLAMVHDAGDKNTVCKLYEITRPTVQYFDVPEAIHCLLSQPRSWYQRKNHLYVSCESGQPQTQESRGAHALSREWLFCGGGKRIPHPQKSGRSIGGIPDIYIVISP